MAKIKMDEFKPFSLTTKNMERVTRDINNVFAYETHLSIAIDLLGRIDWVRFMIDKTSKGTRFLILKGEAGSSQSRKVQYDIHRVTIQAASLLNELKHRGIKLPAIFHAEYDQDNEAVICIHDPTKVVTRIPRGPSKSGRILNETVDERRVQFEKDKPR